MAITGKSALGKYFFNFFLLQAVQFLALNTMIENIKLSGKEKEKNMMWYRLKIGDCLKGFYFDFI